MNYRGTKEQDELICRPLSSIEEIKLFLDNPPAWRTLCKELVPHSDKAIKNTDISEDVMKEQSSFKPQSFCHVDPESDEVPRRERSTLPQVLVCHDMANGYHDDSYIDGTGNDTGYTFYNWAAIDIFCYFSHHLITIPPLAWINVGHAHGVKVIGTLITEWNDGVEFWNKILVDEDSIVELASQLVAIAKTLKFEGWLLNVENKISEPQRLLFFVRRLHQMLHQEIADAVLIWYDSVTIEGHLTWQNGLTSKNKPFFDSCDGIFTNYSWAEKDIVSSVSLAGERIRDLYIGIDVWGRNFIGGGQFNTAEAVKIVNEHDCSLAIFAPAWTFEAASSDNTEWEGVVVDDDMTTYDKYILRDRVLWLSLWPYLNTKLPDKLPFHTSFCRGHGKKRRLFGEVICPVPWYNLRHMEYQPNSQLGSHGYILSMPQVVRAACTLKMKKFITLGPSPSSHLSQLSNRSSRSSRHSRAESPPAPPTDPADPGVADTTTGGQTLGSSDVATQDQGMMYVNPEEEVDQEPAATTKPLAWEPTRASSVLLNLSTSKTRLCLGLLPGEQECLELYLRDSFVGGSCLKINPKDLVSHNHRFIRLFHCDFQCSHDLIVCVVTKTLAAHSQQYLNVVMRSVDSTGRATEKTLVGRNIRCSPHLTSASNFNNYIYPIHDDEHFRELQHYVLLNEPSFYVPVVNSFDWDVRYYEVEAAGCRVTSVHVRTGLTNGPILLGHFGLCARRPSHT